MGRVQNFHTQEEAYPKSIPIPLQIVLERSCYDCHSNYTRIPWYGSVFPVNFLLRYHVEEGREHLNFSDWDELDPTEKANKAFDVLEVVQDGTMPPVSYQIVHWDSILDTEEVMSLQEWYENLEKMTKKSKEKQNP